MMANPYAVPGRMTPAQVHYVMRQLLTALAFMHAHELIHRDVKVRAPHLRFTMTRRCCCARRFTLRSASRLLYRAS